MLEMGEGRRVVEMGGVEKGGENGRSGDGWWKWEE